MEYHRCHYNYTLNCRSAAVGNIFLVVLGLQTKSSKVQKFQIQTCPCYIIGHSTQFYPPHVKTMWQRKFMHGPLIGKDHSILI